MWMNVLSITALFSSISAYCFKVVKVERLTIFAPSVFMWSQTKQIQSVFGSENSVEEHLCLWHWKADFSWFSFFIGLSGEPGCCVLILLQASPRTVFFEVYFLYVVVKLCSLFISQCIFWQTPSDTALWRFMSFSWFRLTYHLSFYYRRSLWNGRTVSFSVSLVSWWIQIQILPGKILICKVVKVLKVFMPCFLSLFKLSVTFCSTLT